MLSAGSADPMAANSSYSDNELLKKFMRGALHFSQFAPTLKNRLYTGSYREESVACRPFCLAIHLCTHFKKLYSQLTDRTMDEVNSVATQLDDGELISPSGPSCHTNVFDPCDYSRKSTLGFWELCAKFHPSYVVSRCERLLLDFDKAPDLLIYLAFLLDIRRTSIEGNMFVTDKV